MEFIGKPGIHRNNIINRKANSLICLRSPTVSVSSNDDSEELEKKYLRLCQENAILRKQNQQNSNIIEKERFKIRLLESKLLEREEEMDQKMTCLESNLKRANSELITKNYEFKTFRSTLSNLLSETQLELLREKKDKVHWSAEDMAKAFTIYHFSKKCYLYLKHNLKYPLPGISTVEQWATRNKVVLRIPAYEILKGLKTAREEPNRKRKHT